ncbi:uncharacterized protein SPSK_09350 [Sporothrix schenckii 1099-18]|uniref:Uncharacterized protein n=1 Tax=Sporothrix schenckii 1099-18 TaxID=1397361 RepID=A0A0F2M587_SPOSC|nr:uncharacterized protein SPSK_09350 [Sporothrix schenckii 1099-18]KJR84264.1 hypothetical protein SPSK_09350 [Sporothrix schenckii 1099-18]
MFQTLLSAKVRQGDVRFDSTCSAEEMQDQLKNTVSFTFQAFVGLYGFPNSADVSSITGTTTLQTSASEDAPAAQQPRLGNGGYQYTMAPPEQEIGNLGSLAGPSSSYFVPNYDPYLQHSPSDLSGNPSGEHTGDATAAADTENGDPNERGVPTTAASLIQSLPYVLAQSTPDPASPGQGLAQALHPQRSPFLHQMAETNPYTAQVAEASNVQRRETPIKPMGPPSHTSSRKSRQRASKKNGSRSEKRTLPPLQPAPHRGSQHVDPAPGLPSVNLAPSSPHPQLPQGAHGAAYSPNVPQQAHIGQGGYYGQHGHYGHYGHTAGPPVSGSGGGAHIANTRYTESGHSQASEYYDRVTWVAGAVPQGPAGVSLPPMETQPYDAMPLTRSQANDAGYYNPQHGYGGPHREDYRSHQ